MSDKLQKLLAELKNDYLKDLPIKITRIADLLSIEEWEMIQAEFHKLKGTGKTYGFPEVSVLGEYMENYLKKQPKAPHQSIILAMDILRRSLNAHQQGLSYDIALDVDFITIQKINSSGE